MSGESSEEFSWWKTNLYSYIMGLDEKLWDILEDGVGDLDLDEEGAAVDRKKYTPAQNKNIQETSQDQRFTCSCYTSFRVYEDE